MTIVEDRKLDLCERVGAKPIEGLVMSCPECDGFFLFCCSCDQTYDQQKVLCCHHYRLIFTDGACTYNGRPDAKAGFGVAYGKDENSQRSVPITDAQDNSPLRSNQRAELLAAIVSVEWIAEIADIDHAATGEPIQEKAWIIATDLEYVVKGITEWLPHWKVNGMRTSKGTKPANLDLFLKLDAAVSKYENEGYQIGFWHVPRNQNELADRLAKDAAKLGHFATPSR